MSNSQNVCYFCYNQHSILLFSYYNMFQLYRLENKIDLDELSQKDIEDWMSEINEKTQTRLSRLQEEIIKIQLEQWINDLWKEVDLNYKPKHASRMTRIISNLQV